MPSVEKFYPQNFSLETSYIFIKKFNIFMEKLYISDHPQIPDRTARLFPGPYDPLLRDGIPRWRWPHAPHDAGDHVHGQKIILVW